MWLILVCLLLLPRLLTAAPCMPTPIATSAVHLGWLAPVPPSGYTLGPYLLERQVTQDSTPAEWTPLPAVPATATTAQDRCPASTTCTYRLRATTAPPDVLTSPEAPYGEPPPCVTVAAAPPPVIDAPTALTATAQCTPPCVILTWETTNSQRAVFVERLPLTGDVIVVSFTVQGTTVADTGLAGETNYCYRARYTDVVPATWTPTVCATTGR
jgi:hypothetical protein